jgi:hypothetical protein
MYKLCTLGKIRSALIEISANSLLKFDVLKCFDCRIYYGAFIALDAMNCNILLVTTLVCLYTKAQSLRVHVRVVHNKCYSNLCSPIKCSCE